MVRLSRKTPHGVCRGIPERAPEQLVLKDVFIIARADPVHVSEDVVVGEAEIDRIALQLQSE